ncbi:MAG: Fur family transcriptional regulator, partial [Nitrospinota bacterium]
MSKRLREREILEHYIAENKLKLTRQRRLILDTFLEIESHLSAEELYRHLQGKDKSIGLATVYRTLKLLSQAGLAAERRFGDGQTRYEHVYAHEHHDHLVCERCGE